MEGEPLIATFCIHAGTLAGTGQRLNQMHSVVHLTTAAISRNGESSDQEFDSHKVQELYQERLPWTSYLSLIVSVFSVKIHLKHFAEQHCTHAAEEERRRV